ncbi:30S ribosomal protein S1 [Mariprofundus ferrooxydans]|uniref:30S ribosomal protein S1 n=1 Tax=Mariprofundus ferrooxydans TaxID=314344 RepID=UPI001430DCAE|nr:30S ribosomal protein S1 [Mariprofundus ferrooxydans]
MSEAEKLDTIQKAGGEADVVDTASATAEATPEVVAAETETTAAAPAAEEPVVQASEESDETPAEEAVSEEDSFRLLYEASLKEKGEIRKGEMVTGMVVGLNADVVVIDVGTKAEGTIPLAEFEQAGLPVPAIGTEIKALIQSVGGSSGVSLSVLAIRQREAWDAIEAAVADESTVDAVITSEVKGGYRVSLSGLNAFMPRSEADTDIHVLPANLIGKACKVAVLEARRRPENIVVSRRRPLTAALEVERAAFFAQHAVGDRLSGEVKRLADFGAFVDIGGVDALLHVSDVSWRRIKHPSEMLSVGQSVSVEIVKLNAETGKVSVSMKALQSDPWDNVEAIYEPGMGLTGTVRRLLDFGAVVELEPGIEGMIHRSELSWTNRDVNPAAVLAEGDVVDVVVLEVDASARRIRLSLKAVSENPWQQWMADHPIGTHVSGKIKNITDFGFFVHVADGMDGLVHMENLSWEKSGAAAMEPYSKGQEVEAVVLGVDVEKQRIALGIKQLSADPFELFLAGVKRGNSVNGTVVDVKPAGVVVELADGVQAFMPMREVPRDHGELKVGSEVEAKIVEVNNKRRQVTLSIRQHLIQEEREAMRNYSRQTAEESAPSALALELQRKLFGKK